MRDFGGGFVNGQRVLPPGKKIYRTVAEFAEGFRLYRWKENKHSE
jgi:hypothetical protein